MNYILKMIFAFSGKKLSGQISLRFVQPDIEDSIDNSNNGLAPNKQQAITWTNKDPVDWLILNPKS